MTSNSKCTRSASAIDLLNHRNTPRFLSHLQCRIGSCLSASLSRKVKGGKWVQRQNELERAHQLKRLAMSMPLHPNVYASNMHRKSSVVLKKVTQSRNYLHDSLTTQKLRVGVGSAPGWGLHRFPMDHLLDSLTTALRARAPALGLQEPMLLCSTVTVAVASGPTAQASEQLWQLGPKAPWLVAAGPLMLDQLAFEQVALIAQLALDGTSSTTGK